MRSGASPRTRVTVVVVTAAVLGLSSLGVAAASTHGTAAAAAAKPPQTVRATRVTRQPGTLAPGSNVRPAAVVGQRVFTDAKHGFALASPGNADYPVATSNGGKTWKTNGPALHLDAAQGPLAVTFVGAVSRKTLFAWGGGSAIDVTSDGGKHWYRALFQSSPVAVVPDLEGHLVAFVAPFNGSAAWHYLSKDGGRTWQYQRAVGP
jgi:photosystem II stability/assembly factor-like uncharacterized protein